MSTPEIRPFQLEIPQAEIDELRTRLATTRWPEALPGPAWSRGVDLAWLKGLADYWRTSYDWRKAEAEINQYPQFTTTIDGQNIHFLHVRSPEPNALPIVLSHSWPGSIVEFLDLIGPLTDPVAHGGRAEDAFHVVVPHLPGFGFSTPLADTGWDMTRIAQAWDTLMRGLGYDRYGAYGGDTGALVGRELGVLNPDGLVGTHLLHIFEFPSGDPDEMARISEKDAASLALLGNFQERAGFVAIQSTRPGTLGFGLTDSPVGVLAWIGELLASFGDGGDLTVDRDRFLTNVMLYWLTRTSTSSAALYYEDAHEGRTGTGVNTAPTGVAVFAKDFRTIRVFAERNNTQIVHWSEFDEGGHFAALEAPALLTGDLRDFFRSLR